MDVTDLGRHLGMRSKREFHRRIASKGDKIALPHRSPLQETAFANATSGERRKKGARGLQCPPTANSLPAAPNDDVGASRFQGSCLKPMQSLPG
jgi:hypothetical protein